MNLTFKAIRTTFAMSDMFVKFVADIDPNLEILSLVRSPWIRNYNLKQFK